LWPAALTVVLPAILWLLPPATGHAATATPIQHLVVIFQENVSFDHYFATYPAAQNPAGEPRFAAAPGTPSVNGLGTLEDGKPAGVLLTHNPTAANPANGSAATGPFRLDRSEASTCDQDHDYGDEQEAADQGLMDLSPAHTGVGENKYCKSSFSYGKGKGLVMGYFDGNTVTALWNYAQHFALNDNFYGATFGPSTPGMANLVAGNTYPTTPSAPTPKVVPNNAGPGTLVGDLDPTGDPCSKGITVSFGGKNIGDLLTEHKISWGAFMGGFDLSVKNAGGSTGCKRSSPSTAANEAKPFIDYIPHHAFFQYWPSTANLKHTRPASPAEIGHDGPANHQYDLHDFFDALKAGTLPSVSILKAISVEDGHAGYSDPLLEQRFLVQTVNAVMRSPDWASTAIVILWDDSDGWYDHQMGPIVNPSAVNTASAENSDQLNGAGTCGHGAPLAGIQGRCGYGPRLPLLVISPYAKANFVDHALTDQSSVIHFIEDNWGTGRLGGGSFDELAGPLTNMLDFKRPAPARRRMLLDPKTGEPM
jgi:phospholipase C